MASVIRKQHQLPAIRLSMRFKGGEPCVQFRAYHGGEELVRELVSAENIGFKGREGTLTCRRRSDHFQVPGGLFHLLDGKLEREPNEPLWLQIDRSADSLAMVPWERLVEDEVQGPILRIPNFLVDPRFNEGPLVLVLVVSSPRAKQSFMVHECTRKLIRQVQLAVSQGTEIHVFADEDAYPHLKKASMLSTDETHSVVVHDPQGSQPFGLGGSSRRAREQIESPWLRWIEHCMAGRAIDAVHWICPGYDNSDRGFLALAKSPVNNTDRDWSHFIGLAEMRSFLDILGAWAVVLGAPYHGRWSLGLRLLANELAWTRPGPVMMYEDASKNDFDIKKAYAFLFGPQQVSPPKGGGYLLYCHPRRLEGLRNVERELMEAPLMRGTVKSHEWLEATQYAMNKLSRSTESIAKEPRWFRTNRMVLEQLFLNISDQHSASARGRAGAIQFLSSLQSKYESGGE